MSNQLGVDISKNPYKLNLGRINAILHVDKKHQTSVYNFMQKFLSGLRYAELRFGLGFLKPFLASVYEEMKNNLILYDTVRSILGVDMVVDSSKNYLKAVGLYKTAPKEVRIILLKRDGRAVFYSGLKRNFSRKDSLMAWKNTYTRAFPLLSHHVASEHVLHIKYEDMVCNTRTELIRTCNFVGLEFEENMLDFTAKTHHITDGNDMRFNKSSIIKADTMWQGKLSIKNKQYFEMRAGALNRKLGYK
jgi:hypothetical protein